MFLYYTTIVDKNAPSNVFGFAIGCVIIAGHICCNNLTGGAVNPIRIIGPCIV